MFYMYIYLIGFTLALIMFVMTSTRIEKMDITVFDFALMSLASLVSWIMVITLIVYIVIKYGEQKFNSVLFKAKKRGSKE